MAFVHRLLGVVVVAIAALSVACTGTAAVGQTPRGAPIVRIPLRLSNVHLVKTTPPVLIDAGTLGDLEDLRKALDDQGVRMKDLGLVVITHGHADHAGLAFDLRRMTGAKLMLGAGDLDLAKAGHNDDLRPSGLTAHLLRPFITDIYPSFAPDVAVKVGSPIDLSSWGIDGQAIAMPGHTSGSLVVVMSDHSAFVGDMMLGGVFGGAFSPSSPGEHYYQADAEQNRRNIKALLAMGVAKFYLGHGGPVTRADVMAAFP